MFPNIYKYSRIGIDSMNEQIVYSLASALILLIIHVSMSMRKMTRGRINKAFTALVIVTFATAVIDVISLYIDGDVTKPDSFKLVVSIFSYIIRNLSFALYTVYIVGVTDTSHRFGVGIMKKLMFVPLVLTIIVSCSTLFYNYVFFIDKKGFFVRGDGILILYILNFIYLLIAVLIILTFRKNLGRKRGIALVSCAVNAIVAYAIGVFWPYLHFDILAYTLGILYIMLIVMNPESRLDSQSGLLRHGVYYEEIRQGFFTNKKVYILEINIQGFDQISSILSYEKLGMMIRHLSERLELMCKRLALPAECFYIKDGEFRVVISREKPINIEKDAKVIFNMFNGLVNYKEINVEIKSTLCVTKCPDDFDNFDSLFNFESGLKKFIQTDKVYFASEIIKDREYELISRMEEILERGLNEGNLKVYYQPIYNIKEKCFDIAEALLRLNDKEYGEIPPEVFIPVAEANGYMDRIERAVLDDICRLFKTGIMNELGIKRVDMNLTVGQCLRNDLVDVIKSTFDKNKVDPSVLYVGITESVATEAQKVFTDNIKRLDELGIGICIDNFGIGYSTIANISLLPVSYVKFDKDFVNGGNSKQEAILDSSIEMIKAINKKIIIEGIETEDKIRKFEYLGCDYIQGFYFSKAMPIDHLIYFIKEFNLEHNALR